MSDTSNRSELKKVVVAMVVVCIVLVAGLVGMFVYNLQMIREKDNAIFSQNMQVSSLNAQVSSLNNNISDLQNTNLQLQGELDGVMNNTLPDWITNMTVTLEGNLTDGFFITIVPIPYNCWLRSGNQTIGVQWNGNVPNDTAGVRVTGCPRQTIYHWLQWVLIYYYVEAVKVEPL